MMMSKSVYLKIKLFQVYIILKLELNKLMLYDFIVGSSKVLHFNL